MTDQTPRNSSDELFSTPSISLDQARQLSSSLGVQLFSTNLHLPEYRLGAIGRWRLICGGFGLERGYSTGLWCVWGLPALLRDTQGDGKNWETWMSLSPLEIESQGIAPRHARGYTVVMGLGMGWVAINIALNPAVRRVSVIERDPDVIALFSWSNALAGLPAEVTNKIEIIQADALEWRPDPKVPVDFLYADIWRALDEPQALADIRQMQSNVRSEMIYFWGQELTLHALCLQKLFENSSSDQWVEALQYCRDDEIRLPLLLPSDIDYVGFVRSVAHQRSVHRPDCAPTHHD